MKDRTVIIFACLAAAAAIAVTAVGIVGSGKRQGEMECRGISVSLDADKSNKLVSETDVVNMIDKEFGGYINRPVTRIDLGEIEDILQSSGYFHSSEAYFTCDGILHVELTPYKPVVRMTDDESLWYIDISGRAFKVDEDWDSTMVTIKGMPPVKDSRWAAKAAEMCVWLDSDKVWSGKKAGITSDSKGELSVSLAGRPEEFSIGGPDDFRRKFARIGKYMDRIAPTGMEYTSVNVKYKGQIICK